MIKKVSLICGIAFMLLTFTGAGYVLFNHGKVNAGYAVVPMLWTVICFSIYRSKKTK